MATVASGPAGNVLLGLRLTIRYCDQSEKPQSWRAAFIRETSSLVFSESQMAPQELERFRQTRRDWRRNPCLIRYRSVGQAPELICQRGQFRGKRRREWSRLRGVPVALEFQFAYAGDRVDRFRFGSDWLAATGAIV